MRTIISVIPVALLFVACGSLRKTAAVRDDVYDIPDRQALAAAAHATEQQEAGKQQDDYYDPQGSRDAGTDRDYYDMTYNDPYYYNYGRFGFGMGLSYGWPTSFGGMTIGYGTGYGYDPYWGNSWMSGYGYYPYGYYGYGNYGYGYGGYGMGYGYQGLWGSGYAPPGPIYVFDGRDGSSSGAVYGHRSSISSGMGTSGQVTPTPRMYRSPVGLLRSSERSRTSGTEDAQDRQTRTITIPDNPRHEKSRSRPSETRPSRSWGIGGGDSGGRINSPRR
jgi:hypothetical protein